MSDTPKLQQAADGGCPPANCSLSSLNEAARRYRKEHFQRANADPTDEDAKNGYYYEEGRTRAYAEGLNALAAMELEMEKWKAECKRQWLHLSQARHNARAIQNIRWRYDGNCGAVRMANLIEEDCHRGMISPENKLL